MTILSRIDYGDSKYDHFSRLHLLSMAMRYQDLGDTYPIAGSLVSVIIGLCFRATLDRQQI